MVMSFDIDTERLPIDEAEEIRDLVSRADFFSLPEIIPSDVPGIDQFRYELTIESEERQHTVGVGDAGVPESLRPLLYKIRILSRSARKSGSESGK